MRILPLRPATAMRSPSGENATVRMSAHGHIELLADLARRRVDDLQLVAEADDRQLLAVRVEAHGGDRVLAGRQFEHVAAARERPTCDSARSPPPEASVLPSGESTTEWTQSAWPSKLRFQLAGGGVPNGDAMVVGRGGDRLAIGRDRRRRSRRSGRSSSAASH